MRLVDVFHPHDARWRPASRMGRWAVGLASAAVLGVALSVVGFATGLVESASSFSDNWALTAWGAAVLVAGGASAATGVIALLDRHDHSWSVVLATVLGTCVLLLLLNEVLQGV
jgi:hypothetical protein